MDETDLIEEYVRGSQGAFAQLVRRYADLVYSAARRQVRDCDLADDVTQAVFIVLAKKAASISGGNLAGWLVKTTWFTSKKALLARRRRARHELEAAKMKSNFTAACEPVADGEFAAQVDAALSSLGETDRTLIARRFLQDQSISDIAQSLGLGEGAVRKRVGRALDKLRGQFPEGLVPSVGVMTTMLSSMPKLGAPAALMESLRGAAAGSGGGGLAKGILKSLAWAKAKVAAACIGAVVATGTGAVVVHHVLLAEAPVAAIAAPAASAAAPASQPVAAAPGVMFSGVVWDEARKAVANVQVVLERTSPDAGNAPYPIEAETRTAADGSFTIGPVAPLPDELPGNARRLMIFRHPDYALTWRRVESNVLQPPVVRLGPTASISGAVRDAAGKGIGDALVKAFVQPARMRDYINVFEVSDRTGEPVHTDSNGKFTIAHLPVGSQMNVFVSRRGYASYWSQWDSRNSRYSYDYYPYSAGDQDVQVQLASAGSIRGRVTLQGRTRGRAMEITPGMTGGPLFPSKPTDADGNFSLADLAGGSLTITAHLEPGNTGLGVMYFKYGLVVEPGKTTEAVVEFPLENVSIGGTVSEAGSHRLLSSATIYGRQLDNSSAFSLATDEHGHFSGSVQPGAYRLIIQSGPDKVKEAMLTVSPGKPSLDLSYELEPRGLIYLRLVDKHHVPCPGRVWNANYAQGSDTDSDARGYILPMNEAYQRGFAIDQSRTLGSAIEYQATPADIGDVVMMPLETITGQVVDKAGVPEPEAQISGTYKGADNSEYGMTLVGNVTMTTDGHFSAQCIPNVRGFRLYFQSRAGGAESRSLPTAPGTILDVGVIHLNGREPTATATLSGTVLDEFGKPLPQASLNNDRGIFDRLITDHRGRFTITGLPIGQKVSIGVSCDDKAQYYDDIPTGARDVALRMERVGHEVLDKPAPELLVSKWFNTKPVSLAELRGRVVLIQLGVIFPDLDSQMAPLLAATEKYRDKGLYTLAIHQSLETTRFYVDEQFKSISEADVSKYLESHGIKIPFAIDQSVQGVKLELKHGQDGNGATFASYYCHAMGTFYLIDKDGNVAACPGEKDLDTCIEQLLKD